MSRRGTPTCAIDLQPAFGGLLGLALLATAPAGAAIPDDPPVPGDAGTFTLRDGATITGKLLRTGEEGDVLELTDETHVRFPPGGITALQDARARAGEATRVRAVLRGGAVPRGPWSAGGPAGSRSGARRPAGRCPVGDRALAGVPRSISTGPDWARAPADGPARDWTLSHRRRSCSRPGNCSSR